MNQLGIGPDPGQAMPVILVHGFTGNPRDLAPTAEAIDNANIDLAVYGFDYSQANTEWVDHPQIGPGLRQWIICLSDVSQDNDGVGRVAIVAHSMGGLAARRALSGDHDGEPMAERVSMVATLGTPHLGSVWAGPPNNGSLGGVLARALWELPGLVPVGPSANLDTPAARGLAVGSTQLAQLPPWPAGLAVWAGAGQFIAEQQLLFHTRGDSVGDLVVGVPSATAAAPVIDRLGGAVIDRCRIAMPLTLGLIAVTGAVAYALSEDPGLRDCAHGRLTRSQPLLVPMLTQVATAARRPSRVEPPPVAAVTATGQAVPPAVLETAIEIYTAASANDLEALGAIAAQAPDFTYTFGAPLDSPVSYWSSDGEGGAARTNEMLLALRESVATDGEFWWWPAEWITDPSYFGFRIGIDSEGAWRYSIAGD